MVVISSHDGGCTWCIAGLVISSHLVRCSRTLALLFHEIRPRLGYGVMRERLDGGACVGEGRCSEREPCGVSWKGGSYRRSAVDRPQEGRLSDRVVDHELEMLRGQGGGAAVTPMA